MKLLYISAFLLLLISCVENTPEPTEEVLIDQGRFDSVMVESSIPGSGSAYSDQGFVQHDSFPSRDGLVVFADIYERKDKKPVILLCHQAGYSRGEYSITAFRLGSIGFSSMAIDQRSGKESRDIINKTALMAKDKGMGQDYLDAKQDIEAAIDYLYERNDQQPIILVGSSYSASLALIIGKNNDKVKGIAAFSPGEYLKGVSVKDSLMDYTKPIFVTSSKEEIVQIESIIELADSSLVSHFKPQVEGIHGSRALWDSTEGNDNYWNAFEAFLKGLSE